MLYIGKASKGKIPKLGLLIRRKLSGFWNAKIFGLTKGSEKEIF